MPAAARRADQLMANVMQVLTAHRTRFFSEPGAERFCIYMSVVDARCLDEANRAVTEFRPVSDIKDGDHGTLAGLPFVADASVRVGRVFIGYRVDALEVDS